LCAREGVREEIKDREKVSEKKSRIAVDGVSFRDRLPPCGLLVADRSRIEAEPLEMAATS
jgi:hypothetical protein